MTRPLSAHLLQQKRQGQDSPSAPRGPTLIKQFAGSCLAGGSSGRAGRLGPSGSHWPSASPTA
eukprot:11188800-Lingulodinium_polyedra.AAC.1